MQNCEILIAKATEFGSPLINKISKKRKIN